MAGQPKTRRRQAATPFTRVTGRPVGRRAAGPGRAPAMRREERAEGGGASAPRNTPGRGFTPFLRPDLKQGAECLGSTPRLVFSGQVPGRLWSGKARKMAYRACVSTV